MAKYDEHETSVTKSEPNKFRSYSSQILASTVKNFLLFDLGLAISFPTIIIPALRKGGSDVIKFSAEEITWVGSIVYICEPVGAVFSGMVTEPWGRKKAMFIVNQPFILAWLLMGLAKNATMIFSAAVLMGFTGGFMESAVLSYIGEISQPAIRGLLASWGSLSTTLGFSVMYFLGRVVDWRTAAFICLAVPLATSIALFFIPETPLWLLSKGRKPEAVKSLQWLRGWTSEENIREEFQALDKHHQRSIKCETCVEGDDCPHLKRSLLSKIGDLFTPGTMKPFFIITVISLFSHMSGISAIRMYYVQIYETYDLPILAEDATVITGFIGLAGKIVLLSTVEMAGKRKICLTSFVLIAVLEISLGIYALKELPEGETSFNNNHPPPEGKGLIPMILFFGLAFLFNFGIYAIPWMLLSEIFPFKSRGFATGFSAAVNYTFAFIATKTYLNVEQGFGMHGSVWFYALMCLLGFAVLYFILPETEGRSLTEIEDHFSTPGRSLTDIHIKRQTSTEKLVKTTSNE